MNSFARALPIILPALLPAAPATAFSDYNYEIAMLQQPYSGRDLEIEASTRPPNHISQVPENISVVTSGEIEAMSTHTAMSVIRVWSSPDFFAWREATQSPARKAMASRAP